MGNQVSFQVRGMSCGHCIKSIENSVGTLNGVEKVNVQLENGKVDVEFDASKVDVNQIKNVIEVKGYTVED